MDKIKVYYFTAYDITSDQKKRMPRPATLEAISAANGVPIYDSAQEVDRAQIDDNGFLKSNQ